MPDLATAHVINDNGIYRVVNKEGGGPVKVPPSGTVIWVNDALPYKVELALRPNSFLKFNSTDPRDCLATEDTVTLVRDASHARKLCPKWKNGNEIGYDVVVMTAGGRVPARGPAYAELPGGGSPVGCEEQVRAVFEALAMRVQECGASILSFVRDGGSSIDLEAIKQCLKDMTLSEQERKTLLDCVLEARDTKPKIIVGN